MRWSLWNKPLKELRPFNAMKEKPFFREPFKRKRFLMPRFGLPSGRARPS
jgi:hypothetical protein